MSTALPTGWQSMQAGARALARTVVPVACPGCDHRDVRWCQECAAPWWEEPFRAESGAGRLDVWGRPPLPVWAVASLVGSAHGMIAAWKDADRRDLDRFFADAMARCAAHVAPTLAAVPGALAVVPVPARRSSTRARGADLPGMLAHAAARGVVQRGVSAQVEHCLVTAGRGARRSTARDRWRGARARVRVSRAPAPGTAVVLVDDVITSGATLAACVAALEDCAAAVVTSLTLAATPSSSVRPDVGLG